ncbi:MAG: M48 family metallopeptidase [Xanthomonadales bacterium]|nr:M48 family metalloprotease [Gammaproteobacteria bacterium]MBT8073601.1 M48 family metalloprotease [Gammaproteobacteria bacterium]NNK04443.1 M48 family metallopeptidase [Xanthomonadales bacterium]NNL00334.1 M48 family metallopeptidase [Xanthomonadales bacterium]
MISVKQKHGLVGRLLIAVMVSVVSLSSIAQSGRVNLPELGNSASNVLSASEEREYGESLIRQMRAYELLVEDPLISDFFSDMGFNLASNSDQPEAAFTFVVLDQDMINAFAAPGGVIALHSGLILLADTQDEVAGVLSHEIAHITQLHMYRAFEKGKSMNIIALLAMMGLILASGGDGEVITGAVLGAQGMAAQAQINFTRHNEIEADRVGIRTLSASGYDPQGMADFFEKMGQTSRANGEGPPEFLRTHPVSVNRIAEAKSRIQNLPPVEPREGRQFYIVQARLRALLDDDPKKAIDHFQTELEKPLSEARRIGNLYGLAIARQKNAEYDKAENLLSDLLEAEPLRLAFQLQMANLQLAKGQNEMAISALAELYHTFPGNQAIALEYGKALLDQEKPDQAETASKILKQQLVKRKNDPALYALYARAENLSGNDIKATEAIAESYYQRGGTEEAITQLESLTRRSDLDYYQRARVSARLMELRIEAGDTEPQAFNRR